MQVQVYVHPVDTGKHPTQPGGFRWAVHAADHPDAGDLVSCVNAGHEYTQHSALWMGDRCGATAASALRHAGQPVTYPTPIVLDHDPTPVDDRVTII